MANEELKQRNIERVYQTVYELVLLHGIDNTTKEMLSRASGISRSSIDRYFINKTDCMLQTAEWIARQLNERMNKLSELVMAGTRTGAEMLRIYLYTRRDLYYQSRNLFVAVAELRLFIYRNCADGESAYARLTDALGYKTLLTKILAIGKADGTLLSDMDEQEEAIYINGFYRELLINLAMSRGLLGDREQSMIEGFIAHFMRYYGNGAI